MSSVELLSTSDHLAVCESCREFATDAAGAETILSLLRSNLRSEAAKREADHVPYEQLAALVDGQLDGADRELVESHLEMCSPCAEEVNDLRTFSASIAAARETTVSRAARLARERLRAFGSVLGVWSLPRFASVAAAALVLLSIASALVFVWRPRPQIEREITQDSRPSQEKTSPTSPPEAIPETTPAAEGDTNAARPSPQPVDVGSSEGSPQVVVALNDGGGRVTLDSRGRLSGLDALSPAARRAVKSALMSERLEAPAVTAELAGRRGTLLGAGNGGPGFSVLGPFGTVVRDERPHFRWRALADATSYKVTVLDSDFNVVATSPPLTVTNWSPPSGLARGSVYSWQVAAVKGDGQQVLAPTAPAPEARFKILESEKASELVRAERVSPGSHLVRGVLYARVGLLDDAERELRALVAANPQSPSARKLLRSIQTIKGKGQKAKGKARK
jgi:hypothetical protein